LTSKFDTKRHENASNGAIACSTCRIPSRCATTCRSETYPIGRERLDAALSEAGVERVDLIYFLRAGIDDWQTSGSGALVAVTFRAKGTYSERVELRVHAVPSKRRQLLGAALTDALPQLARWIRNAETSENVWRSSDHALTIRWTNGAVVIDED
jgi:hypothetical protein